MRTRFLRFRAPSPRLWLAALLLALTAACLGDTVAPAGSTRLRPVSGGDQVALLGEAVGEPLRVRVEDAAGTPLRGVAVEWVVAAGGGTLDEARAETDRDGIATVRWTLGAVAGEQRVEARVAGAVPLVFAATATEVADFRLSPRHVRLGAVGQEHVLRLMTRGTDGDDVASGVVTWVSADPGIVSVFGGRLTATGTGATTVIAMTDGAADTVLVSVGDTGPGPIVVTGIAQQRKTVSEIRLTGTASGNGYEGQAWMEWGRRADLADAAEAPGRVPIPESPRAIAGSISGFELGDTVYYRAAAINPVGTSRGAIARYIVAPPGPVTDVTTFIGPANFLLKVTWTAPEGAYGYAVERREPGQATWTSTPLYTSNPGGYWAWYPSLEQARTVEFRVKTCNGAGCTYSNTAQQLVPRLDPPQGVAAAVADSGHVRVTWTDGPYETSYHVFRRIEGTPDSARQVATVPRDGTSYTDRGVLPGVTYVYSVRSLLSFGGRTSPLSAEAAATPGGGETYPPTAVTGTGIQPSSPSAVVLRGTANGNNFAGHAWIEWGIQPDLSDAAVLGRDTLPATGNRGISATVTGVAAGTTMYFRAVAQNRYATVRGAISSYTVALPDPAAGVAVQLNPVSFRANLSWVDGTRTATWAAEKRRQGEAAWTSTRTYSVMPVPLWYEYPDMSEAHTMEYRVRSCNGVGCVHSAIVTLAVPRLEPPQSFAAAVNASNDVVLSWAEYRTATAFEVWRREHGDGSAAALVHRTARYATTWTDTAALEGVTYVYTMRSVLDPGGRRSVYTPERTVTTSPGVTYPPTATTGTALQPTDEDFPADPAYATLRGSAAGNNFAGHLWFEWGMSPTLSSYTVVGRDTLPATGTKAASRQIGGLTEGSTFYFRMVAENRYGTVRGDIRSYTVAPPEPGTGFSIDYGTTANYLLKLYWTPGERTAAYAPEYREPDGAWMPGLLFTGPGGYWAHYPSLDSTRTMYFRVRSCNAVGCTYSTPVSHLIQRFDPPQNVTGRLNTAGDVVLTWTDATMETSYAIYRKVAGSAAAPVRIGTGSKNAVTYTDTTAPSGATYEYTVRGVLSFGSRFSPPSPPVTIFVP